MTLEYVAKLLVVTVNYRTKVRCSHIVRENVSVFGLLQLKSAIRYTSIKLMGQVPFNYCQQNLIRWARGPLQRCSSC